MSADLSHARVQIGQPRRTVLRRVRTDQDAGAVRPAADTAVRESSTGRVGLIPEPPLISTSAADLERSLVCGEPYTVTPTSNRVALRLSGPRVQQSHRAELPPEGLVVGAVQVPRDGQPVLFLADHPVTGGYPVLAVVRRPGLALAAQLGPGQAVRFVRAR